MMTAMDPNPRFIPNHEVEGIRSRAIARAERKVEEREHLRLEIQSRKLIQEMESAALMLFFGYEKNPNDPSIVVPMTRDRIASLKAGADIADKLLKKVLPDLKQVELSVGDNSDGEGRILDSPDLANRMRLYLDAMKKRGVVIPMPAHDEVIVDDNTDFLD